MNALTHELASGEAKLAASCIESENTPWSAYRVANCARKNEEDLSSAPIAASGKATDATKQKVSIIGLDMKDALRWVLTQTEIELQAAILGIRTGLESDDSEALRSAATCRAVLHSRVAKLRRSLPDKTDSLAGLMRALPLLNLADCRHEFRPGARGWH